MYQRSGDVIKQTEDRQRYRQKVDTHGQRNTCYNCLDRGISIFDSTPTFCYIVFEINKTQTFFKNFANIVCV